MAKKKSKKPAKSKKAASSEPKLSFEESFEALRNVLAEMESGDLSLADSMAHYERGVGLLRACHETLGAAKIRIEKLLEVDKNGDAVTEPFEHKATFEESEESESEESEDEESESGSEEEWDGGLF